MDTSPAPEAAKPKKNPWDRGIFRIHVARPLQYVLGELVSQDDNNVKFHVRIPTLMTITLPTFDLDRAEWLADTWPELIKGLEAVGSTDVSPWTASNWRKEVKQMAALLFDDVMEQVEDELPNYDDIEDLDEQLIELVTDSDWYADQAGRLAVLEFASSRYEVMPSDILKHVRLSDKHRWQSVQKATCLAYMIEDVRQDFIRRFSRVVEDEIY